jgi:hypothetical protein
MMKMLALSGVEVMGVGPQDLTLGRENLLKLIDRSPINVVSANLPGFLPYVRLNKDGGKIKVLITSVIDPEVMKKYHLEYDGEVVDPVSALENLQKKIDHDYFIVIVQALGERISTIINGCPGIDLVVDGLTLSISDNLDRKGVVPLICNNRRGQYVNYLEYRPGSENSLSRPVLMRASTKKVKEDPEIKVLVKAYNKERIEYSKQQREKKALRKMQEIFRKNPPNLYLGNRACESCHPESAKKWQQTRHAGAIKILVKKGRADDPECVKCHVTGMPIQPPTGMDKMTTVMGGFSTLAETPWMANVQCEACHGPGANHIQKPLQSKMKVADENSCRVCHTEETDPEFNFQKKFRLIEHNEKKGK